MAEILRGFCSHCETEMGYTPEAGWRCPHGCTTTGSADNLVPGERPSWWAKPLGELTEAELADFTREAADAMRGLGDRVSLTLTRPISRVEEPNDA